MEVYRKYKREIAVAVLDIMMPDVGAREVFHRIRAIDPAAQVIEQADITRNGMLPIS